MTLYGAAKDPSSVSSDLTDLTDSSGGSSDGTVQAVSGSGADAAVNNNFAELTAKVNALNTKVNALIDALRRE